MTYEGTCLTCKYCKERKTGSYVCTNVDSDYAAETITEDDWCDLWWGREGEPDYDTV